MKKTTTTIFLDSPEVVAQLLEVLLPEVYLAEAEDLVEAEEVAEALAVECRAEVVQAEAGN